MDCTILESWIDLSVVWALLSELGLCGIPRRNLEILEVLSFPFSGIQNS